MAIKVLPVSGAEDELSRRRCEYTDPARSGPAGSVRGRPVLLAVGHAQSQGGPLCLNSLGAHRP